MAAVDFPVTVTRIGGLAGFADVLVIDGDGLMSVTRKNNRRRDCRLTAETVQRISAAVAEVSWESLTPDDDRPRFPDDLVVTLMLPTGGPIRLPDPQVGSYGQVFHDLLGDLGRGPTGARMSAPIGTARRA